MLTKSDPWIQTQEETLSTIRYVPLPPTKKMKRWCLVRMRLSIQVPWLSVYDSDTGTAIQGKRKKRRESILWSCSIQKSDCCSTHSTHTSTRTNTHTQNQRQIKSREAIGFATCFFHSVSMKINTHHPCLWQHRAPWLPSLSFYPALIDGHWLLLLVSCNKYTIYSLNILHI